MIRTCVLVYDTEPTLSALVHNEQPGTPRRPTSSGLDKLDHQNGARPARSSGLDRLDHPDVGLDKFEPWDGFASVAECAHEVRHRGCFGISWSGMA